MWNSLIDADPSGQILATWIAKEELPLTALAPARTEAPRGVIVAQLHVLYAWCASTTIDELHTLAHHDRDVVARDRSIHPDRHHQSPRRSPWRRVGSANATAPRSGPAISIRCRVGRAAASAVTTRSPT
jgi:hypothetical protein